MIIFLILFRDLCWLMKYSFISSFSKLNKVTFKFQPRAAYWTILIFLHYPRRRRSTAARKLQSLSNDVCVGVYVCVGVWVYVWVCMCVGMHVSTIKRKALTGMT